MYFCVFGLVHLKVAVEVCLYNVCHFVCNISSIQMQEDVEDILDDFAFQNPRKDRYCYRGTYPKKCLGAC